MFDCMSMHSYIYSVDKYLFNLSLCQALKVEQRPRPNPCPNNTFTVMVEIDQKKEI